MCAAQASNARLRTRAATLTKCNVALVLSMADLLGEMVAMIAVLELPPSTGCSRRVRWESLYGMCLDALLALAGLSARCWNTLPSVSKL